jgi:hypothetical protein
MLVGASIHHGRALVPALWFGDPAIGFGSGMRLAARRGWPRAFMAMFLVVLRSACGSHQKKADQ